MDTLIGTDVHTQAHEHSYKHTLAHTLTHTRAYTSVDLLLRRELVYVRKPNEDIRTCKHFTDSTLLIFFNLLEEKFQNFIVLLTKNCPFHYIRRNITWQKHNRSAFSYKVDMHFCCIKIFLFGLRSKNACF